MQLRSLYILRFHYPDGWQVDLTGDGGVEEHHYYFAEGRCEGAIQGRFRAANHPRRRTDRTFAMNMQGFIETDDGALITIDYQGYGRPYPPGRRQIVGAAWHLSSHEKYHHLNDSICTICGEVRAPEKEPFTQADVDLVMDIRELIWEPPQA